MIRLQHISFKDWNPIGKPHKKPKRRKIESSSAGGKRETLSEKSLNSKITLIKSADLFGEAATLELTHSYGEHNNYPE